MRCIILLLCLLVYSSCYASNNDTLILKILKCESNFRSNVYGDGDKAYGIAQFHKETFYRFATKSIKDGSWRFGEAKWKSPEQQVFLLDWAIKHKKGSSWTCYTKIKTKERLIEQRKRNSHMRNMPLRKHNNTLWKPVWDRNMDYMDSNVHYRNYGPVQKALNRCT